MLVNLTTHSIVIETAGSGQFEIKPSGTVARVTTSQEVVGEVLVEDTVNDGVQVKRTVFGEVEGLPEPRPGVTFIVSSLVASRVPDRADVVAPDTGPTAIRENGQIVAVRGFQRF